MADQRESKPGVIDALPTDALKEAGQQLLGLLVQRATEAAAQRVSGLADRLTDVTASGGDVRAALNGGKARDLDRVDPADADDDDRADDEAGDEQDKPGGLKGALSSLKDKIAGAFGGGGGGGAKKLKMTNIVESLDIGLPLRRELCAFVGLESQRDGAGCAVRRDACRVHADARQLRHERW